MKKRCRIFAVFCWYCF